MLAVDNQVSVPVPVPGPGLWPDSRGVSPSLYRRFPNTWKRRRWSCQALALSRSRSGATSEARGSRPTDAPAGRGCAWGKGIASRLNAVEKGTRGQAAGKGPTKGSESILDASQGGRRFQAAKLSQTRAAGGPWEPRGRTATSPGWGDGGLLSGAAPINSPRRAQAGLDARQAAQQRRPFPQRPAGPGGRRRPPPRHSDQPEPTLRRQPRGAPLPPPRWKASPPTPAPRDRPSGARRQRPAATPHRPQPGHQGEASDSVRTGSWAA